MGIEVRERAYVEPAHPPYMQACGCSWMPRFPL